ncbi:hypothetical protein [Streptomyces sp. NBC_01320]|uniref:hypothetical protein n=1 Tax=Streptomyces sp. NBC_01320 TaxID=2903824 RepID=UPI002E122A15|nr:hypothetical protein OG395_44125 [Streptomyces sp. NBC_01320]
MNLAPRMKRAAAAAGATAVAAAGMVMGVAAPASAATSTSTICASGNYRVHFEFPQQGTSGDVSRGVCQVVPLQSGTSYVKIWGYWNTNPGMFYVGTGHPQNPGSTTFYAGGTTTSPYLTFG